MSDIYCKAPWTSTTYMPGGKFTPCCSWGGNHFDSPEQVRDVVGGAFLRGEIPKECMNSCPPDKPGWRQMFQHYPTDLTSLQVHFLEGAPVIISTEGGTGSGANPMDFSHEPHRELITDFMQAISEKRSPRVSGADALKTQALISELLEVGQSR
jgi:hypothetical protein